MIRFGNSIPFAMITSGSNNPAPGKSVTVLIAKEGGVFAAPFGAIDEVGGGFYRIAANIHDTDTPGTLMLLATADGCDPTTLIYVIEPKPCHRGGRRVEQLLEELVGINQDLLARKY